MTRSLLVVFNDAFALPLGIQGALDQIPQVSFWYRCFPNAIFVTANLSANDLAGLLRQRFGADRTKRFIVAQLRPDEVQGWLPSQAWHMINNPLSPREPAK